MKGLIPNCGNLDSSSPTSALERCAHISLDHRTFLQWMCPLEFTQNESGSTSFGINGASAEQNGKDCRPSRRKTVRLIVRPRELLSCYSCYSRVNLALLSRYSCYGRVNYGLSNNLPRIHVVPARLDGDEPAVFDQNFGRVHRSLPVPDRIWSEDTDISCADGGFGPVLEPVEQFLRRRRPLRFLGWWPSLIQPFK